MNTLEEVKNKILKYKDFYGQDIADVEDIKNANTKEELMKIAEEMREAIDKGFFDEKKNKEDEC